MPPKIFISYSHADEVWKDRLHKYLNVQVRLNRLTVWEDRQIRTGEEWNPAIEKAILESDIAVLLVTIDFLNSDFIQNQEIPFIQKNNLKIMPIIISPCAWDDFEYISKQQGFTKNNQPLEELNINRELNRIVKELCHINLLIVPQKESLSLKDLLTNYLHNPTPLKEAMLDYIPMDSFQYDSILDAYLFDELFDILLKEMDGGYLYCVLHGLGIEERYIEAFGDSRKCKKNSRSISRVLLLVEPDSNKGILACNIDIWYLIGVEHRHYKNLKNVNFKEREAYEGRLSTILAKIKKEKRCSQSIEMQLIIPNELFDSKYDFKNLKIKFESDGFLDSIEESWSTYFDISTKFFNRYKFFSIDHQSIIWWKEKSKRYNSLVLEGLNPSIRCFDEREVNPFKSSLHRDKQFFFSNKSLLEKGYINKILEIGYPFVVCPQQGEHDIGMMNIEDRPVRKIKSELFIQFNKINSTIHYIHDDAYDTQQLILAKDGKDDNDFLI